MDGRGEDPTPPRIDVPCDLRGANTEIYFEDGFLYQTSTECRGHLGPQYIGELPAGTLAVREVNPAGLAKRSVEDVIATGHIGTVVSLASDVRGVCPTCSGTTDESVHICEAHGVDETAICPECRTTDEVRIPYQRTVCKSAGTFPIEAVTEVLRVVDAFCHEQGINLFEDVTYPDSAVRVYAHHRERDHELISSDPVRIRFTVPGKDAVLQLTLREELDLIDVTREHREPV